MKYQTLENLRKYCGKPPMGTTFIECNFRKLYLPGADLSDIGLVHCCLDEVDLTGANLSEAGIEQSSLRAANLRGIKFNQAVIIRSDFFGSNLENADFDGTNITGSDLRQCNLIGVKGLASRKEEIRTATWLVGKFSEYPDADSVPIIEWVAEQKKLDSVAEASCLVPTLNIYQGLSTSAVRAGLNRIAKGRESVWRI